MRTLTILLLILLLASCQVKERPIAYGQDECEYCKMMVMDHRYGSEMVTDKGKVYTFDAAECLIDYLQYNEEMADAMTDEPVFDSTEGKRAMLWIYERLYPNVDFE